MNSTIEVVSNVRFMANWATVLDFECKHDVATTTLSDGCEAGADGREPNAFSMRGQVYW